MANVSSLRNDLWKWLTLAILAGLSFYALTSDPVKQQKSAEVADDGTNAVSRAALPGIRLGLDLRGGTSFTLGVDENRLTTMISNQLASAGETEINAAVLAKHRNEFLAKSDSGIIETVRRRIDGMGMNEPVIQGTKNHGLVVQLPGANDKDRDAARATLQKATFLEFLLLDDNSDQLVKELKSAMQVNPAAAPEGYTYSSTGSGCLRRRPDFDTISKRPGYDERLANTIAGSLGSGVGAGPQLVLEKKDDGTYQPHYVSRVPEVTGKDLKSARVDTDPSTGELKIDFEFKSASADKFARLTGENIGKQLAIVIDKELISAPVIRAEISERGNISGSFTMEEAKQLANNLNSGALPVPLKILAETSVAPTVGEDAIEHGKTAAVLGFSLVALFMLFYYRFSGFVADIALFLDIALLPASLVVAANILGALVSDPSMGGGGSMTLPVITLPGIAGMVLSLGMAVDANVLVFERIREEFKGQVTAGTALKNGYGRAFSAIFDSNLTTIIIGVILFSVGTGPIRGFAITLTAGVIISMFTALAVTRLVFERTVNHDSVKPFSMMHFFKKPSFDFVKSGKAVSFCAVAIIVGTIALFCVRLSSNPASVLAVDLTGGTAITYKVSGEKPDTAAMRKALEKFDNAAVIQQQSSTQEGETVLVKTGYSTDNKPASIGESTSVNNHVTELLQKAIPSAQFKELSVEEVGSVVGEDLKKSGTWAVVLSLIAILIYVAIRFEFGFALGAVAALAHDALISLGIYSLCGRQISLITLTAILTIIGYSVNDTIVVFDRIREDLRKDQRGTLKDICNAALNQTLSRTFITSVTTLLAIASLFAFGEGSIYDFALTMFIGVTAGTFSSIFIATPVMMWWYRGKRPQFEKVVETAQN